MKFHSLLLLLTTLLWSCDNGPKVIQSEPVKAAVTTSSNPNDLAVFKDVPNLKAPTADEHTVVVEEVLDTEKYSYLKVKEGTQNFWVAISKAEVEVGETYYFKGGLLKKNFFSREFDRIFDTVYLVSKFWKKMPAGQSETALEEALATLPEGHPAPNLKVGNITPAEGAITLAALFKDTEKYANQTITITGKCMKVNPMIMGRNWLHIQDGSGEEFDLTVTTSEKVALGAVVTVEGTIALDKDFGAGYRYDIIMEEAVLTEIK
ncbi:MAG: hypothetical protein AB8G22_28260 [Saprospiraceae bacterium]